MPLRLFIRFFAHVILPTVEDWLRHSRSLPYCSPNWLKLRLQSAKRFGAFGSQEVAGKQYELCGNERPTQRVFFSPGNGMLEVVVIGN